MSAAAWGTAVSFVFYTGMGDSEPWINRMTSVLTGKFMHCEVVFTGARAGQNQNRQPLACGIWQNECVFLRPRTFGKDCWVWRSVKLSKRDVDKMFRFCKTQADNKIPFNRAGFLRCISPFPRPTDGKQWFCSELCMAALQEVGLFANEIPSAVTPTYLHELLATLDSYASESPHVEERIAKTGPLKFKRALLRLTSQGKQ